MSEPPEDVLNVLLVDDDPATRDLLSMALEGEGRRILLAGDGMEAEAVLNGEDIHVVICDMMMPRMDGLELCRRLRARKSSSYVYFILMTGAKTDSKTYEDAALAEVDDFVVKPNLTEPLRLRLRAARRLLNVANRLRELEGIIPICSHCRRLRNEHDVYQKLEAYFAKRDSRVKFSHGICPECLAQHYGGILPDR